VVGAVSGDEGDLGTRGEGGDGDGRRGFSPWLRISSAYMSQKLGPESLQCRCQGTCYFVSYDTTSAENERRHTQKSSCQGGTIHYHRYIPLELIVSIRLLRLFPKHLPGASELIL